MSNSLLSLIYPLRCIHCKGKAEANHPLLCITCSQMIELLDLDFKRDKNHAALFENIGPLRCLIHLFLKGKRTYLAKLFASFALVQLSKLRWDEIDVITYCKGSYSIEILALELGKLLNIPSIGLIKRNIYGEYKLRLGVDIEEKRVLCLDEFLEKRRGKALLTSLQSGFPQKCYLLAIAFAREPLP